MKRTGQLVVHGGKDAMREVRSSRIPAGTALTIEYMAEGNFLGTYEVEDEDTGETKTVQAEPRLEVSLFDDGGGFAFKPKASTKKGGWRALQPGEAFSVLYTFDDGKAEDDTPRPIKQ